MAFNRPPSHYPYAVIIAKTQVVEIPSKSWWSSYSYAIGQCSGEIMERQF